MTGEELLLEKMDELIDAINGLFDLRTVNKDDPATIKALIEELKNREKHIEEWFDENIECKEDAEVLVTLYDEVIDIVKKCIDGLGECEAITVINAVDGLVSFANIKIQKAYDEYSIYADSCIQELESGKISKKQALHVLNNRTFLFGFKQEFWHKFSLVSLGIFLNHPNEWDERHDYSIDSLKALENVIGHNDEIEELCNL